MRLIKECASLHKNTASYGHLVGEYCVEGKHRVWKLCKEFV